MKVIECPRDAMQGIHEFIPTATKIDYLNQLLKVGFDTIDFGSFVSPKAIPQMRDTSEVLSELDLNSTDSKLLAIVANVRGAIDASIHSEIDLLGFPLSISETFQQRNTNKSIDKALVELQEIQEICTKKSKTLVAYISMGFGNPYGDLYNEEIVGKYTDLLAGIGVTIISLADTIGVSNKENITSLFTTLIATHPNIEFGAHLHSNPTTAIQKIEAAYMAGCKRFDGAINGLGGCPMAKDDLVGNLATETIISVLEGQGETLNLSKDEFKKSMLMTSTVFPA